MYYPLNLLRHDLQISPIFKDQLVGTPYILDLSSKNPIIHEYRSDNFDLFQKQIFTEIQAAGCQWGVGAYLEERKSLLSVYPQMLNEQRFYHVGLDIVVPADTFLYSPLSAEVYQVGNDAGQGNYGGYVILKHDVNDIIFYSFYGHLKTEHSVAQGDLLLPGQVFARIGERADSGYWFTHTHLQILTQRAVSENRLTQGYIKESELVLVDQWFPSPYFLFKW